MAFTRVKGLKAFGEKAQGSEEMFTTLSALGGHAWLSCGHTVRPGCAILVSLDLHWHTFVA